MPHITLETYPPTSRADYDEVLLAFTIPYRWLSEVYNDDPMGAFDLDYFLTEEYTWDDTLQLLEMAQDDGVIIKKTIVKR